MEEKSFSDYNERATKAETEISNLYSKINKLDRELNNVSLFKAEVLNELKLIKKEIENQDDLYLNLLKLRKDYNRALHWCIKIGNLKESIEFFTKVFGMKVLRHEEFSEGCEAKCNGDYSRPWSKTMIGFNDEKYNFSLELTYNYGIYKYKKGNDLKYISLYIKNNESIKIAKNLGYKVEKLNDTNDTNEEYSILGPDSILYHCKIIDSNNNKIPKEPFISIALNVTNLKNTYDYWIGLLGMHCLEYVDKFYFRSCFAGSISMEFFELNKTELPLKHEKAQGRIAFNTRLNELGTNTRYKLFSHVQKIDSLGSIHTPPVTLSTPGKADVNVIILSDPDNYEICFVGEKGFDDLCTIKPGDDIIDWKKRLKMGADTNKGKYEK